MERRAGRVRVQLLFQAAARAELHRLLNRVLPELEGLVEARRVRWHVDVDPVDLL
jgi:primosomal protein N' (replication factor Y)